MGRSAFPTPFPSLVFFERILTMPQLYRRGYEYELSSLRVAVLMNTRGLQRHYVPLFISKQNPWGHAGTPMYTFTYHIDTQL